MTKVLHIITRMDMGGSAQNTLLTCDELAGKYEMVLVHGLAQESGMTDRERETVQSRVDKAQAKGVTTVAVPALMRRINPVCDMTALVHLIRIIKDHKPDIVHTHTSKAGILGRLAAKIADVPAIVHTPHGHVFYGHFGPLPSTIFTWVEKLFALITHRMIALTAGEKEDYIKLALCPPQKLSTIHSGVDIEKFQRVPAGGDAKKAALGLPLNRLVVGFVGWLLPIKGPMHLLKAMEDVWQEYDDIVLVFFGKGDLEAALRAEALKLNANANIHLAGWRDDIDEVMPLIDILVLPSLNEGMGRVLVEAMAAAKPIVASNVGGIPDLVRHEVNGLLVPPGDEKALAAGIKQLIDNPGKARLMGQAGRKRCRQFSLQAMVEKIDRLYQELSAQPQPDQPALCELGTGGSREKYEARISKSETNHKFEGPNFQNKSIKAVPKIDQGGQP